GYNLIEWDPSADWFDLYKKLVASKYFVGPVAFHRPDGETTAETWVLVPERQTPFDMLRRNRHGTYISDGPRLERFTFLGPGLIDDEWEGHWYGYRPGEEVRFALAVSSQANLKEVVLYDGEEVLARFTPGARSFARTLRFPAWRDYCLHLTAEDEGGGRIYATFPAYTRNLQFWGHVGSDNMNNYVNAMRSDGNGYLGVGRDLHDMFGFVTFGAAWGDYVRITPALRYSDFMPRQEISGIIGSFNVHHPSPILQVGGRRHYLNDHRRVFPFCGADAQAFRSEIAGEHIDNDENLVQVWHGARVVPTRIFLPVPGLHARDEYVVWRWQPKQQICVEVTKDIRFSGGALEEEWITFASNSHYLLPDLRVRSIRDPSRSVRVADLPVQKSLASPNKEWDNSHYLRAARALTPALLECRQGGELEIGDGGVGTFGFIPLGTARHYRCLLFRGDRELAVFFQCQPTDAERAAGRILLEYLLVLDPTETDATPFAGLLGLKSFSRRLHLTAASCRSEIDLDALFPDQRGRTIHLRVSGLPGGTVRWEAGGRMIFASQSQAGRSYHMIASDMPRRYRLRWEKTLR
ncbi:MAG: hypothetical protein JXB04_01405, partial [Kiritimatiellae bacterium]|nr:hypothetical protein [Kiritimatiellia bacterium]